MVAWVGAGYARKMQRKGGDTRSTGASDAPGRGPTFAFGADTASIDPPPLSLPSGSTDDDDDDGGREAMPGEIAERYERREVLGVGGMGVVWRYWDRRLDRPVAIKAVRATVARSSALPRFEEEVRITTRLQHPGIIPVHDLGRLDDGRLWFAMKEVRGRTLETLLSEVHAGWRVGRDEAGFSFRRMLEVFLRVCETVAYAHARGVVHRDLKPSNVMVGAYGEVLVLDWGLARVLDATGHGGGEAGDDDQGPEVRTARLTAMGSVTGTPAYMAPEQARGEGSEAGLAADVYALGATLYDLLTERPPRLGADVEDLLRRVAEATPVAPPSEVADAPWSDDELDRICMRAIATDPADRYPDAGGLAEDLAAWLDGARRRERALALVDEADGHLDAAESGEAEAASLTARATEAAEALPATATADDKGPLWALQDQAAHRSAQANADRTRAVHLLRSALSHAPDLPEAHDRLADHFLRQHTALELRGETLRAATALADLAEHDRSRRHAAYIRGTGAITLVTEPSGAEARLHRYVEQGRRLVPVFERVLGRTPLVAAPLDIGAYLVTLHAEGRDEVRYPVLIRRQEHWDGVPPGADAPWPIALPAVGALGPDDCYLPAGWFWSGDDAFETTLPLRREWLGPRVMRRFPVTIEEYAAFLDRVAARDGEAAALALAPRMSEGGGPFLDRDDAGRWLGVRADPEGPVWDALRAAVRLPVVYVDLGQASAFARDEAARTGQPWRLPTEREWQRAARGADPRNYPWGDTFEASWTCCRRADMPHPHIVSVDAHPIDASPYGVRGLAGNVLEWAVEPPDPDGRPGASYNLGGSCSSGPLTCRVTYRSPQEPGYRAGRVGFRLVRGFS